MKDSEFFDLLAGGKNQMEGVLSANQYTSKFGVSLTEQDAVLLLHARRQSLKEQERAEFGGGILPKLIYAFCDSSYVYQDNYVDTLERLQEIFYLYKNESMDELTDDELIDYMKERFEGECQGSLDYLEDTCLERFAREIRRGGSETGAMLGLDFMSGEEEDEERF